jgi:hypothetical protein
MTLKISIMNYKRIFIALALPAVLPLAITACSDAANSTQGQNFDTVQVAEQPPVALAEVPASPEFPNAALTVGEVKTEDAGRDSVKVSFNFNVANYELKAQTADAGEKNCNNSKDGQHIHFILDDAPYKALYEPKNEITVAKNSEHHVVAFLSRSYHQSLKNKGAGLIYHFRIDERGALKKLESPTKPMLTYSRPKGDYTGKDVDNVLLDFYVWNATLGNDYKVKANITTGGKDTSFMISEWKSYFIKNLITGESTIKLTLTDKEGNKLMGASTEMSRNIQLAHGEPMK